MFITIKELLSSLHQHRISIITVKHFHTEPYIFVRFNIKTFLWNFPIWGFWSVNKLQGPTILLYYYELRQQDFGHSQGPLIVTVVSLSFWQVPDQNITERFQQHEQRSTFD